MRETDASPRRSGRPTRRRTRWPIAFILILSPTFLPAPLAAQETDARPDSVHLVREAREKQAEFEAFRASRIPPQTRPVPPRCDRRIGRICHWFGGADEADFPPEPVETELARQELLQSLAATWSDVKDAWVLGQLVHYLVEDGRLSQGEQLARTCGLAEPWWCEALRGYVLHLRGEFPAAEAAFRNALEGIPAEEAERWTTPRYVLSREGEGLYRSADPDERRRLADRLWRFSDPLFLVEGNDRLTDHYARLVLATIREDAENPFQMPWAEDLEETLVRYGRTIGWSRSRGQPRGGLSLQDTRSVVSHHDPASRGYLFPEEFLPAPADVPPEAWITAPREAHTWYAPPYAPDFRALETQVARFRRGDSLLVVGAFRPDPVGLFAVAGGREEAERNDPFTSRNDPFASRSVDDRGEAGVTDPDGSAGPVRTGLFLEPEDGGERFATLADAREGVLTLRAPTGRYVSSLEVLDEAARSAWRARQGVQQSDLPRGLAGLSDILILREGAPLPADLEEAIPLARPGIRVARGERFAVAWEVYGLGVEDAARVTLGFTRGRPGFLRRVGEFLGVLEPDVPVEITFEEAGPDAVQTLFRAVHLELPDLDPGEYTLHVRLELGGMEPAIVSRPLIVEP